MGGLPSYTTGLVPVVMDGILKLCEVFVVTLALCHTDPHVGGVKQTQIMIFYEGPESLQSRSYQSLRAFPFPARDMIMKLQ